MPGERRQIGEAPDGLDFTLTGQARQMVSQGGAVFLRRPQFEVLSREGDQALDESFMKFPRSLDRLVT